MAQKAQADRGLVHRKNREGKKVWYCRLYLDGRMRWFGSFPTKTEARQCYEEAKTDQRRGQFFSQNLQHRGAKRLAQAIEDYMRVNHNRTVENDRHFEKFWKARLPNMRLVNITPALLETIKGELLEKQLANQTVLHYLKFLRHILNLAVRDRHINQNPFAQVEMPKVSKGRLRFLSMEEEHRLLEAIGPRYASWVRFAILTGLRQAEQFRLKWTDVDLDRGILTLPKTKSGECQYAYLNQEAITILKGFTSWKDSKWLFPSRIKGKPRNPKSFYKRIYLPALQHCGLQVTYENKSQKVDWHTLRHTFASRLGMSGATEQEIAACLRHSSTALVKRYTHLSQPHLHSVTEKVSQFGQTPQAPQLLAPTVDKCEIEPKREVRVSQEGQVRN